MDTLDMTPGNWQRKKKKINKTEGGGGRGNKEGGGGRRRESPVNSKEWEIKKVILGNIFKITNWAALEIQGACVCVYGCVCQGGIAEYNKTYYRILIWWKLRGVWHCVLQINLPSPQAFMGVYKVFCFAFISKMGKKGVFLHHCVFVCVLGIVWCTKTWCHLIYILIYDSSPLIA